MSLEIVGERTGDLTADVYRRLFAVHPDMEALFCRDTDGLVRGEMLTRVFEAILDFIDARTFADSLIQCEVVTHDAYGVPPAVFADFFGIVRDAVRAAAAEGWTQRAETAWNVLLADVGHYVAYPDQKVRP